MCAVSLSTERHSEPKHFSRLSPSHHTCNSLPVKILPISSLQSRFWRHLQPAEVGNFNKKRRLSDKASRLDIAPFEANSFVWKILRVNYLESRFCSANSLSRRANLFVIKILSRQAKKRVTSISSISLSSLSEANFAREASCHSDARAKRDRRNPLFSSSVLTAGDSWLPISLADVR